MPVILEKCDMCYFPVTLHNFINLSSFKWSRKTFGGSGFYKSATYYYLVKLTTQPLQSVAIIKCHVLTNTHNFVGQGTLYCRIGENSGRSRLCFLRVCGIARRECISCHCISAKYFSSHMGAQHLITFYH